MCEMRVTSEVGKRSSNVQTNRSHHGNQVVSDASTVKSYVPQGTVLILIFDIDTNPSHSFLSFVQGSKVRMKNLFVEDTERQQTIMNQFFLWATGENMLFRGDKVSAMLSRKL